MKWAGTVRLVLFAGLAQLSWAQTFDTSGNALLNGTDYFRQVYYFFDPNTGDPLRAIALYGNIAFDGNGHYSITGSVLDSSSSSATPQSISRTGTYSIAASGMGFISSPGFSGDSIYGLVSQGLFIGSSTENTRGYNDLFIAAPVGATPATNATFNGSYYVAYADPTVPLDAAFQLTPNGQGSLGTVNATGYAGTNASPGSQAFPGVTYSFSNGAANVTWHGNSQSILPLGAVLYISPDGNVVFGGDSTGFDMFVGVRTGGSAPNFSSLYYQAGIDLDYMDGFIQSYYGSVNVLQPNLIGHERVAPLGGGAYDYTFADAYSLNADGTYDSGLFSQHYVFGNGGAVRIGFDVGPVMGLSVALRAPSFSGPGVYLNPIGVTNAASFSPFTAHVSPGEFITLFGTGLASSAASAPTLPLPPTLNNVQVMINGRPAPIQFVSQTQISVVVPYLTESVAQIQVINNGVPSNIVTELVEQTSPGIFTYGAGYADALHTNFSLVSPTSPAQPGETIQVYLTGLGPITPAVNDGVPGSATPPYNATTNQITAAIDASTPANVSFAGLAPGFAGVYQLNIAIPAGLSAGDHFLDIFGPDSFTSQALISIGSGGSATTQLLPQAQRRAARPNQRLHASPLSRGGRFLLPSGSGGNQ